MRLSAILIGVFLATVVFGQNVAASPGSPSQRAILSARNGVQTLVVESRLVGDAGDHIWLLPLPSAPTRIEAVDAGSFRSGFSLAGPKIVRAGKGTEEAGMAIVLVALILTSAASVQLLAGLPPGRRVSHYLALVFLCLFLVAVLFPTYAEADGVGPLRRVGSYTCDVLLPGQPTEPAKWLASCGLTPTARLIEAVRRYRSEHWVLIALRLDRSDPAREPHPVRFVYESEKAIYPLRLVGAVVPGVTLDLVVVGDSRAAAQGLRTMSCQRFDTQVFRSEQLRLPSRSGGATSIEGDFWDGCWMTRNVGHLVGEALERDLVFD